MRNYTPTPYRDYCFECWQAKDLCLCPHIKPTDSPIDLMLLQHPRERKMTINTGRIVKLGINNAKIYYGVNFDKESSFIKDLEATEGEVGILFPSPDAIPMEEAPRTLKKLIVVDGTWNEAKKMLHRSTCLHKIQNYSIAPQEKSNYRIRKAHADYCLSTVEATVALLREFMGDPKAHQHLIDIFQKMIGQQETFINKNSRHIDNKRRMVKIRERAKIKKLLFSTIPKTRLELLSKMTQEEQDRIAYIAQGLWEVPDIYCPISIRPLANNEITKTDDVITNNEKTMTLEEFKSKLAQPESLDFNDTMTVIETLYNFTPTEFKNGDTNNGQGQNNGSCKLFAFAKAQNLSQQETLDSFG